MPFDKILRVAFCEHPFRYIGTSSETLTYPEVKRDFFPFSDAQSAEPSKDLEKPRDSFQTVLHDREG